eukprot:1145505-Pelagomonas_calceolata.AAC.1
MNHSWIPSGAPLKGSKAVDGTHDATRKALRAPVVKVSTYLNLRRAVTLFMGAVPRVCAHHEELHPDLHRHQGRVAAGHC